MGVPGTQVCVTRGCSRYAGVCHTQVCVAPCAQALGCEGDGRQGLGALWTGWLGGHMGRGGQWRDRRGKVRGVQGGELCPEVKSRALAGLWWGSQGSLAGEEC